MGVTGSRDERGYGRDHKRERERWARVVASGKALCVFCEKSIEPTEPWDLDHTEDRTGWRGASHRTCNRSAGGRNGAEVANARRQMTVRDW